MVFPRSQWLGSGFGHIGSTSNRGACMPAASTFAFFSRITDPIPSASITVTKIAPIDSFRLMVLLSSLCPITGRQHFMRIHPDHQVDNLRRGDLAKPVWRVWRNDHDVAGSDLTTHPIVNGAALRARPVQHFDHVAVGCRFARVFDGASGDERRVSLDDVVDLGDLAVLDAAASAGAI